MPERVVHEVRQGLEQEIAVARRAQLAARAAEHDLAAALVRVRLIEIDRVAGEGSKVQRRESFPAPLGLHAGDTEQGREGGEKPVRLSDRGFHRPRRIGAQPARVAQFLQPGAKPRQGRLQIVRDVVGHPTDPVHELLDPVEHRIELLGELVEIVTRATGRDPTCEVAAHDFPARPVDRVDPAHRAPAHRERSEHREDQGQADTPDEGDPNAPARPVDLVHVATDEQQEAAGQDRYPRSREMRGVVGLAGGPERELDPAVRRRRRVRPAAHVARERAPARGGEQIDVWPTRAPGDPILEHP